MVEEGPKLVWKARSEGKCPSVKDKGREGDEKDDSGSDSARICHHRGVVHGQLGKIARTQTRKQMSVVLRREQSKGL